MQRREVLILPASYAVGCLAELSWGAGVVKSKRAGGPRLKKGGKEQCGAGLLLTGHLHSLAHPCVGAVAAPAGRTGTSGAGVDGDK